MAKMLQIAILRCVLNYLTRCTLQVSKLHVCLIYTDNLCDIPPLYSFIYNLITNKINVNDVLHYDNKSCTTLILIQH